MLCLHVSAIGCPTFKAPPHTRQEKENGSLVIGCVSSNKTWKLLCVNNIWLGLVGNCTPRELLWLFNITELCSV